MKILVLLLSLTLLTGCLTAKVQKKPTSELKLRHSQLERMMSVARLGEEQLVEDLTDYEKELAAVELELLHRYQAGDKSAWLPEFSH